MGTSTIHTTAYRLLVDAKEFHGPLIATRKEVAESKRVINSVLTPMQKYENSLKRYGSLLDKNLISHEQFNAKLDKEKAKFDRGTDAAKRRALQGDLLNQSMQRGVDVTNSLLTTEQKHTIEVAKLNKLLERGHITQDVYNRKLVEMQTRLRSTSKATGVQATAVRGLTKVATKAAAVLGGLFTINSARESFRQIDENAKAADKLGLSYKFLNQQQLVLARVSGLSSGQVSKGFEKMTRRTSEAAAGVGEARAAIAELGLDANKLASQGPEQMFLSYADAMSKVTNEHDRLRLATKIFDDEQAGIHAALALGSKELHKQGTEAARLGGNLSRFDASEVERANDQMAEMTAAWRALSNEFAVSFAPALGGMTRDLAELLHEFNGGDAAQRESEIPGGSTSNAGITADYLGALTTAGRNAFVNIAKERSVFANTAFGSGELSTDPLKILNEIEKSRSQRQLKHNQEMRAKADQAAKARTEAQLKITQRAQAETSRKVFSMASNLLGTASNKLAVGVADIATKGAKGLNVSESRLRESALSQTTTKDVVTQSLQGPAASTSIGSFDAFRTLNQTQVTSIEQKQVAAIERSALEQPKQTTLLGQILSVLQMDGAADTSKVGNGGILDG